MTDQSEISSLTSEPMMILQNRWYNSLSSHLCLDRSMFQIYHSLKSVVCSDKDLWRIQNLIPPLSLTFNPSIHVNKLFFDEYVSIVNQFQYPENKFREDIGEKIYQKWLVYLKKITPPPPSNKLPMLFRQWSMVTAPSVMSVGVSKLSQMVLVDGAIRRLQAYQGSDEKIIDFKENHAQLISDLASSVGVDFIFDGNFTDDNIENTWTGGIDTGVGGLWFGIDSNSNLSRQFALSRIKVDVKIKSYMISISVPSLWYNSSLFHTAYSNKNTPPWPKNPNPTWEDVFGRNGSMQRLIISLVLADGINATINSDAIFCESDQQIILRNASQGLWPLYTPTDNNIVTNTVTFDNSNGMRIETITQPRNPVVIGNNVLPIANYLGQAK